MAESELHVDSKNRIIITFHGKQTAEGIKALGIELKKTADKIRAQGKKVLIVSDARALKLPDVSSGARIEGKKVLQIPFDANAVISSHHLLQVFLYLAQASGQASRIRFFKSERKAFAWFNDIVHPKPAVSVVHWVAGAAIGLIGISALTGWAIGNVYLMSWLPSLRPINPMGAVGLLIVGYSIVALWYRHTKHARTGGWLSIILGLSTLLPLPIDRILFADKVAAAGAHTQLADSAGLCFVLLGLVLISMGRRHRLINIAQYTISGCVVGIVLFNMFGMLYAHEYMYSVSDSFVMAFNLAIGLGIAAGAFIVVLVQTRNRNVLQRVSRTGWLILLALILLQVATYGSWSQAHARNKADSSQAFATRSDDIRDDVDQRLNAYKDALYGFKGLYSSSDYVDQREFQNYYESLDLTAKYPGLRALIFVSKVNEKDLPAFVDLHRRDKSFNPGGNPGFAITSKTGTGTHYILTYNASNSTTTGGLDLTSRPDRLAAYQKADETDQPVASGTVKFPASNGQPEQTGFFITIPVANKSADNTIGFVNAVFNYSDFFANTFTGSKQLDGINVAVNEGKGQDTVYASSKIGAGKHVYSYTNKVTIADNVWEVRVDAPVGFGISQSQRNLPQNFLVIGQLLSVLLAIIFIIQNRARLQALELADRITEDLQSERNLAVTNDQKSSAILRSIGDAVFAIDTQGRITLINGAAQHISGYSEQEALGEHYDKVLRFEFARTGNVNNKFVHQALAGHVTSMANHTVIVRKDGKRVQVADSAAPIRDAHNNILGAIIVFRDVSKEYELDKAKTEFVSLASHQLRTPLSAVNWYGEMLLNGDAGKLNKSQHEYVNEIYEGNQRMVELVNSLLDVSRLELGKLTNQPEPTDMFALVNSLEKELAITIRGKNIKVTNKLETNLPMVNADPKLLRMIVQNLMSNAVKYTAPAGKVSVVLKRASASDIERAALHDDKDYWYFQVSDTGYGIPAEQQSKIFSKLFRADNVRVLDVEGTGLGLYIVKEVVEKLGGRVWFDSKESVGSNFYAVLPFGHRETK